jgi:hypothetical protein
LGCTGDERHLALQTLARGRSAGRPELERTNAVDSDRFSVLTGRSGCTQAIDQLSNVTGCDAIDLDRCGERVFGETDQWVCVSLEQRADCWRKGDRDSGPAAGGLDPICHGYASFKIFLPVAGPGFLQPDPARQV